jgi:PPOX class probable F420-dependent enzyme
VKGALRFHDARREGITAPRMSLEQELGAYINLATFKRDGGAVETPVWFAELDAKLYVFTEADSYKVKRLRRNPKVRVARCGAMGGVTGPWRDGTARVIEDGATERAAYVALRAKYGWQMRLVDLVSRIAGRIENRAILEITLQ